MDSLKQSYLYIDCYMQKNFRTNQMVTTYQKPMIDMPKIKRKEFKYISKESQQTVKETREEKIRKVQPKRKMAVE